MQNGCQDIKTLCIILEFLGNIASDSEEAARKVMQETSIIDVLSSLIETCSSMHTDFLAVVQNFLSFVIKLENMSLPET